MLFNSATFLFLFLPLTWALYRWAVRRAGGSTALWVLAVASAVFYAAWDWRFLPLLLLSIIVNHAVAVTIARRRGAGKGSAALLTAAVAVNLSVLAYFKYWMWIGGMLAGLGGWSAPGSIVLPLGISFFTFHVISFLVDTHRGTATPGSVLESTVYFLFFPHLIAGPILLHREFAPQLRSLRLPPDEWIRRGILLIVLGLTKKLLIADSLSRWVVTPYWPSTETATLHFVDAWIAVAGYTAQLYYDFSAYCEIALGLALLLGFRIPVNFWSPYRSTTIREFWQRWHITLGRFLRDYLYIPLGGAKRGFWLGAVAVAVTFLLGGLWHGAGWTFLLWGGLHALYVIIHRLWQRQPIRLPKGVGIALTLLAVMFAWVPFRATDLDQTLLIWRAMLGLEAGHVPPLVAMALPWLDFEVHRLTRFGGLELLPLVILFTWMLTRPNAIQAVLAWPAGRRGLVLAGVLWLAVVFSLALPTEFLYFQF